MKRIHGLRGSLIQAAILSSINQHNPAPTPKEVKDTNEWASGDAPHRVLNESLVVSVSSRVKRPRPLTMHVDAFIDEGSFDYEDQDTEDFKAEKYARWVLFLFRLPASMHMKFPERMVENELFCDYEGKQYKVIGASRLGDIWLTPDHKSTRGYEHRVDPMHCSNWSAEPRPK